MAKINKKESILNSAADLFVELGYSDTTVRLIAKNAGITHPALYQYFASKRDILSDLFEYFSMNFARFRLTHEEFILFWDKYDFQGLMELYSKRWSEQYDNKLLRKILSILMAMKTIDPDANAVFSSTLIAQPIEYYKNLLTMLSDKGYIRKVDHGEQAFMISSFVFMTHIYNVHFGAPKEYLIDAFMKNLTAFSYYHGFFENMFPHGKIEFTDFSNLYEIVIARCAEIRKEKGIVLDNE